MKSMNEGSDRTNDGDSSIVSATKQLKELVRRQDASLARILDLLVQFDELEGWRSSGARHCPAWMNSELGISTKLGFEYLRVGRSLKSLPVIKALFEQGKLSWTKVRALTRIADAGNEQLLAAAALDTTANGTERLCDHYRWARTQDDLDSEDARARTQFEHRSLTWRKNHCGNLVLRLELTPEHAAAFLKAVARCEDRLFVDAEGKLSPEGAIEVDPDDPEARPLPSCSAAQLRADAALLMAESSLRAEDTDIVAADRYQVIVNVDLDTLRTDRAEDADARANANANADADAEANARARPLPPRRASIEDIGAIGANTARRLACDASIVNLISDKGEPLSIGRKSRVHTPAIRRAVLARDSHCQFNGCDCTRHLHLHHIVHWADGGETSVENTLAICPYHHRLVHEHGYSITRVPEHKRYAMLSGIEDEHGRALAIHLGALGRQFKFHKPQAKRTQPSGSSTEESSTEENSIAISSTEENGTEPSANRELSTRVDTAVTYQCPNDCASDQNASDQNHVREPVTATSFRHSQRATPRCRHRPRPTDSARQGQW